MPEIMAAPRRVFCELEGTVFRVYRCAGVGDAAAVSAVTSAAAAAKARAAGAAAKEGQVNKIAGEINRNKVKACSRDTV
jgi:hypothetical protein